MILFAIYAVLIWFFAARWRRTLKGFSVVFLGAALALLTTYVAFRFLAKDTFVPLSLLLTAEGVAVLSVGLFIVCLPARPDGRHCGYCWYDMSGLDATVPVCPECGGQREFPRASAAKRGAGAAATSAPRGR